MGAGVSSSLLFLAIDVAAVVCALLLGVGVAVSRPRLASARLIAGIAAGTVCYVVLARADYAAWIAPAFDIDVGGWRPAMNMVRNLTPGLFMLLCHSLFRPGRRLPPWLWALLAAQLLLEEPLQWLAPAGWPPSRLVFETIPTLLQAGFAGVALYWTVADWRSDLVEVRRATRAFTLIVIGLQVLASSLLLRVVIPSDTIANYHAHVALEASNLVLLLFLLVRMAGGEFGSELDLILGRPPRRPPGRALENEDDAALERLRRLLDEERIYREPGLTLKALADHVGLPEYRFRRLVHERLGFQNFNAFLHAWRIREACEHLRDPAQRRTPILTIALSVGYQSVNTFNRGFREIMGVTPSAWRASPTPPLTEDGPPETT